VRVDFTWPSSTCRHVFGRRCIEDHLCSNRRYSRRCPVCRERWFARPPDIGLEEQNEEEYRRNDREIEEVDAETRAIELENTLLLQRIETEVEGEQPEALPAGVRERNFRWLQAMSRNVGARAQIRHAMAWNSRRGNALRLAAPALADNAPERELDRHAEIPVPAPAPTSAAEVVRVLNEEFDRITAQQHIVDVIRRDSPLPPSRSNAGRQRAQNTPPVVEHGRTHESRPALPPAGRLIRTVGLLERILPSPELRNESRDIEEDVADVERAADALWRTVDAEEEARRSGRIERRRE
jgi:hypothetical protein